MVYMYSVNNNNNNKLYLYSVYITNCSRRLTISQNVLKNTEKSNNYIYKHGN